MILTRAVATFTASSFGRLFAAGDALEMGIAEERLPQVGVARFASITAEESFFCAGGRGCCGKQANEEDNPP